MRAVRLTGIVVCCLLVYGCTNPSTDYPKLLKDLDHGDAKVRCNAALVLGRKYLCGTSRDGKPPIKIVLEKLIERLDDPDDEVRGCAAQGLSYIGPEAKSAVAALIDMIRKKDEATGSAIMALIAIGPEAREATPRLLEASSNEKENIRAISLQALRQIAPHDARTIDTLNMALKDQSASVRVEAAYSLGLIGPEAAIALSSLKDAANDQDINVADAANKAIRRIEQKDK